MAAYELEFVPQGPFSLVRTTARFARHPDPVNVVDDDVFARLVPTPGGLALVEVSEQGSVTRPRLSVTVEGVAAEPADDAARRVLERVLGASADLRPFEQALGADPLLGGLIKRHRGLRVAGALDLFEALVGAVLTQQVNLRFAATIRTELVRAFGEHAAFQDRTWLAFPSAVRVARESESALRAFRMTGAKAGTIFRLANAIAEGKLDEGRLRALPDEEAIAELAIWKGVGRWTAEIALLRGLGRLDIFPAGDLAVVKRLALTWLGQAHASNEAEMRAFSERWRPFRSLALVYGLEDLALAG
jgi:DNA-3-methyladenine glycosylase II